MDVLTIFVFIMWFWLLISVAGDLFRRHDISGLGKAIWVIVLILGSVYRRLCILDDFVAAILITQPNYYKHQDAKGDYNTIKKQHPSPLIVWADRSYP